jgi:hypothetical protein
MRSWSPPLRLGLTQPTQAETSLNQRLVHMPNRRLTSEELQIANHILALVRNRITAAANGDAEFRFALNRKIYKEISYDERDKPSRRKRLKSIKRRQQNNICPYCNEQLPPSDCELDRLVASAGYTTENTHLVHQECHRRSQAGKGYA